jgi:DNA integrity scanning protein DisA with diadenylate cyclase activity
MTPTEQEVVFDNEKPFVDFSQQAKYCEEFLRIEEHIFEKLQGIAVECSKTNSRLGVMVVFGDFCSQEDCKVEGIRQMGINYIRKYISFSVDSFSQEITDLMTKNSDGAFIVNKNGQILATKMYLEVLNPSLDVPEGCGTRHITAASFSTRKEVKSIFTLSEETSIVRIWKDGVVIEQFDPNENKEVKK